METVNVNIHQFKDKLIETGKKNGLPENIIKKLNDVYDEKIKLFTKNLPYKANEIMKDFITYSSINIKVDLINILNENSKDTDPWCDALIEVINKYRVD